METVFMRKKTKFFKRGKSSSHRKVVRHLKRVGRKPLFTVPLATFMALLVALMAGILVSSGGNPTLKSNDSNVVVLNYDKQERTIPTRAKTVGDLVDRLDIKLNPGDVIEPSKDTEIIGDNFRINVYRAVPVTIVDGDKKTFTYSAAATPRSIVKQAGVKIYPEDRLELLPTENFLAESSIGERVVIDRAFPVSLNIYGTLANVRTHAKTVGDLLRERGVKLGENDSVQPSLDTRISAGSQIFLISKGTQLVTAEEAVAMPVEEVEDASLTFGVSVIRQQGAPGKKLVTYQIDLQNGEEIGRKLIQEVVVQEPVKQVVARGKAFNPSADKTAVMTAAGIPRSSFAYADYVIEHESHWNPAAVNSSGCTGLGQACPGSKLAAACPAWRTDAVCQMRFFNDYAVKRYGGWSGAYQHKVNQGWW
jgi:uncharacterized protein YabE (DUF348 family)